MRCLVSGSFDPITKGHIYLVKKALAIADEVYVAVFNNETKSYMFSMEERVEIAKKTLKDIANVKVFGYDGYAVDFCKEYGIDFIVRGFRNETDYAYERDMAKWNMVHGGIETLILPCKDESLSAVSATSAREGIDAESEELDRYLEESTLETIKELRKKYGK